MVPNMGNRLKQLREASDLTQEEVAERMHISKSQYVKLERGERRLTQEYISRAAQAFRVSDAEILSKQDANLVPIMGLIGAGAEINPDYEQTPPEGLDQVELPFPLPDDMIAFEVRGDSMLPAYKDGHIIICYRDQRRPTHAFFGEEAAVKTADGRRFLKTIMRGSSGVNLLSWNAGPIENVQLEWVGEIFAAMPRSSIRKMHQQAARAMG